MVGVALAAMLVANGAATSGVATSGGAMELQEVVVVAKSPGARSGRSPLREFEQDRSKRTARGCGVHYVLDGSGHAAACLQFRLYIACQEVIVPPVEMRLPTLKGVY